MDLDLDLTPFFKKYEEILKTSEIAFERVKKEHPDCVKCKIECADCCHALFDLSLIEALYINHHFSKTFEGAQRDKLLERANRADRKIYQLKRKAHRELKRGRPEAEILNDMAKERVRCPLLNAKDRCELYAYRPTTCRLYGIPTSINGKGHTCGLSGFIAGRAYPTVNLDAVHKKLFDLSVELVQAIKSRYSKLGDMLVPLSMALLTEYNETYLGVCKDDRSEAEVKGEDHD